jgi:pimeloyl-ACP methyl ester carboxylesterase
MPLGVDGAGSTALHVADGSQMIADRVGGRAVTIWVGRERYGSCVRRLTSGRLADGWLPILQTRYVDAAGNRYEQESFAARLPGHSRLASFVRITATARHAVLVRVAVARGGVRTLRVAAGATGVLYLAWERGASLRTLSPSRYEAARTAVTAYWTSRLNEGASVVVPDRTVMDAARALLVQEIALAWRYSLGNPYEEFSFPESLDVAQVMDEWGYAPLSRSIVNVALTRAPTPYPNWKKGEKLLAAATDYRLTRDSEYLARITPKLRTYVADFGHQLARSEVGLLARERYSSDVANSVYGLHSQAVVWEGLRGIAAAWADAGFAADAQRARAVADRLEHGLRAAVARSQRRLPDGSLFIPIALGDRELPYGSVTETRLGSYWNLVMPYALASGLFRPGSAQAEGVLRYMRLHGSFLLGLVRAGAYALYGRDAPFPTGGTDEVYGINVARFLADNDEPDQLVLSLYGQLAAAMSPGTFVGGEADTIAPRNGEYFRTTYLPPNAASNAAFLTKLRLMLVHETRDGETTPTGLELAFATPRSWLRPGSRIAVERMPTSAGPVSYELRADADTVAATVGIPSRAPLDRLRLRLRLPAGKRIGSVTVDGRPYSRFNSRTNTIDLTGLEGTVALVASTAGSGHRSLAAAHGVRRLTIHYRAHDGRERAATVLVPRTYGVDDEPLPLVISPHGRGLDGRTNARLWGMLPALGRFVVISPDGEGRRLGNYSWGYPGQIDDLARMPEILRRALPRLPIDRSRIYAFGGSMGGQEVLLLLARHPHLLAGVAAFDAVADFPRQYRTFPRLSCDRACARAWRVPFGLALQRLARLEVGGSPLTAPRAWAARSPLTYAGAIARSGVPVQLWWSTKDAVVPDQQHQMAVLFRAIQRTDADAAVYAFVGRWRHTAEMRASTQLPFALRFFCLLGGPLAHPAALHVDPLPLQPPCVD